MKALIKRISICCSLILIGCSGPSGPSGQKILGSNNHHFIVQREIVRDLNVSNLHIRQTRIPDSECSSGYSYTIELDGPINSDTSYVVGKIINELPKCYKSGSQITPIVYLNSDGGSLLDGYEIGRIFRKYGVSTRVIEGQTCASACAVAFLGGNFRRVSDNGRLVFHAPYVRSQFGGIECKDKKSTEHLLNYYYEMMSSISEADRLYTRTMSYCGISTGWILDSGASDFFGISKN